MTPEEELFERFGEQLIKEVRDSQIHLAEMFLEQKAPFSRRYKDELEGMSTAQIEMVKEMAARWIDGTLHNLLLILENADWIHLRLEGAGVVLDDIRQVERGDLQGYIFIWAQKYSQERLTDYTK